MSASIRKYDFGVSFDTDPPRKVLTKPSSVPAKAAKKAEPLPPAEPPAPTFSQADLEQVRKKAFAEGEQAGRKAGLKAGRSEAETQINQRIAAALNMIGTQLGKLAAKEQERAAAVSDLPVQLTLALVEKLFPHLSDHHGLDEVEALVRGSLEDLLDQPRVTITLNPNLAEEVRGRIEPLLADLGFAGRLSVVPDQKLGATGCRVEWPGGGAERDPAALIAQAKAAADDLLATVGETGDAVAAHEAGAASKTGKAP